MSMKPLALLLAFSLPLQAAEAPAPAAPAAVPTAVPAATPAAAPAPAGAPSPSSPSAQAAATPVAPATQAPVAPELPSDLSGSAEALSAPEGVSGAAGSEDPYLAEEVGEDGGLAPVTESPDLSKVDSEILAAMANGVDKDTESFFFDPIAKQALPEAAPGAWRSTVDPLYYELARRTLNDSKDKAARQAFALALFKDAERAKYSKDLAYDDRLAEAVIAQVEGGKKPRARMELQTLAEKGNRKARLYLGMDKPVERVDAVGSTPAAVAPVPVSEPALAPVATPAPAAQPLSPSAE